METTLVIHIATGAISVLAGAAALTFRKGETAHRTAGTIFVASMTVLAVTAALLGRDVGNVVAAGLTIYFVTTAWVAARRKDKEAGGFELAAFFVATASALAMLLSASFLVFGGQEAPNALIGPVSFFLGGALALAALGDLSVVVRRGAAGRQRIARHLWRMCLALFIAVGAFFAQGAEALPQVVPRLELLLGSMALVLAVMSYWIVRVLFTNWWAQSTPRLQSRGEWPVLSALFPKRIDNAYRGQWLAIWLLIPLALVKIAMGANTLLNTRAVIETADQVPLHTYGRDAQEIIVFMYQAWGLGIFLMAALGLLALVRYRAMAPLIFLVLTIENVGRKALAAADPLPISANPGTPPIGALINLALIAALLAGLVLSLIPRRDTLRRA